MLIRLVSLFISLALFACASKPPATVAPDVQAAYQTLYELKNSGKAHPALLMRLNQIFKQYDELSGRWHVERELAGLNRGQDPQQALKHAQNSLTLAKQLADQEKQYQSQLAIYYVNKDINALQAAKELAHSHYQQNEIHYLLGELSQLRKPDDTFSPIQVAKTLFWQAKRDKDSTKAQQALTQFKLLGQSTAIGDVLFWLAQQTLNEDKGEAAMYAERALALFVSIENDVAASRIQQWISSNGLTR